jgi:tetratricopeptide (TPR) repeat protein
MPWSFRLVIPRLVIPPLVMAAALIGPAPSPAAAQTGQTARISEETRTLDTYPYSDPNPVPILIRDPRLYPYHSFEGYSTTSRPQEWKVVKLENDYIEVFVLPEVGGKVWGAIVKETGHEFIYRNEVMKFRNIALRGPWTSGGIEFNFGVIGHTPSTASPVDYTLAENPDGSVSCWVGSMDLPSRTHWRVEIRLPADRAYFETNVLWYNPTPLEQPYYNWMTAAAFAQKDLEMSMPGNAYLQHSGQVETWPADEEGRYLPLYANNTFEGHKSYHVVGELNDFFGGYYQEEDYGFGHWARYEDMPGQKLWLWALSREGGVWEDLLTDTDGQYVEFQAGRLFVQYSPGSAVNPITQAGFDPMSASRWTETWFPLEGIGGLSDASREGAMFLSEEGGRLTVGVNSFQDIQDTLKVWSADELVAVVPVSLEALHPYRTTVDVAEGRDYRVQLPGLELDYESSPENRDLLRPFSRDLEAVPALPEADQMVFQAREALKGRRYREALGLFEDVLEEEPWNREALLGLAELSYRSGSYAVAQERASWALQLDAYDAKANFLAGATYRAMGLEADAREAFGWAARSTTYRSAAYAQLAEIMIGEEGFGEAARYARLAIDFDRNSVPAWQALAVIGRKTGDEGLTREALGELLALDPLHHFVMAERFLAGGSGADFARSIGGEFPDQTLLELAIGYSNLGLRDDAVRLLTSARPDSPEPVMHRAWVARLSDDPSLLADPGDPAFEFPYRRESIDVLTWATRNSDDWVWEYLLALNLWAADRDREAASLLEELGQAPDFAPTYVARAEFLSQTRGQDPEPDLRRAVELAPENRTLHIHLIRHYQDQGEWDASLAILDAIRPHFPDDFNLKLLEAKTLMNLGRALEATEILASTHVIPSENARDSHRLWEQSHTMAALDAYDAGDFPVAREYLMTALEWPEHLGQGRPYQPEERLVRFILGRVEERLGNEAEARAAYELYLEATGDIGPPLRQLDLLAETALRALGRDAEADGLLSEFRSESQSLQATLQDDLEGRMIDRALKLGMVTNDYAKETPNSLHHQHPDPRLHPLAGVR